MKTLPKAVRSSANPEQLSRTVRGVLVSLIPIMIVVLGIDEVDANALVDGVVNIVFLATSLWAGVDMVIGLARKIYLGRWSADSV